jgi:crotonobetaine/carnitine-CoA ligase
VHAVPSDKGEDDVKVTAILNPGATLTPEALFHWATDAVPYYALPRYIEVPRHATQESPGPHPKVPVARRGKNSGYMGSGNDRHSGRQALRNR